MTDIGQLLPAFGSYATGINAAGQVVGYTYTATLDSNSAFLYSNGTMSDLGVFPGGHNAVAEGINDDGKIVGMASASNGYAHAFVYADGAMTDLNSLIDPASAWTLEEANAIDDLDEIVGWGTNASGQQHGFLLTPVPEPSTITLLLASAPCLLAYAWRRRRAA